MILYHHWVGYNEIREDIEANYEDQLIALEESVLAKREKLINQFIEEYQKQRAATVDKMNEQARKVLGEIMALQATKKTETKRLRQEMKLKITKDQKMASDALEQKIHDYESKQIARTKKLS